MLPRLRPRTIFAFGAALAVGLFLSVASHELHWSTSTTLVVAMAMVAMLGLFGTPLMLLPIDASLKREPAKVDREEVKPLQREFRALAFDQVEVARGDLAGATLTMSDFKRGLNEAFTSSVRIPSPRRHEHTVWLPRVANMEERKNPTSAFNTLLSELVTVESNENEAPRDIAYALAAGE